MTALTGATGFLGSHLLERILRKPGDVVALVRDDGAAGWARVETALLATGHPLPSDLRNRLRLEYADLRAPQLGMTPERYQGLAESLSAMWHCAGMIGLLAPREELHRVNVRGTRHVLELAAAARRSPRVIHVSTAFVAGARMHGVVQEDNLDDQYGFLTPYEESKFRAECEVRRWAWHHERPVLVMRPSILLTDRPVPPGGPRHPHAVIGARLAILTDSERTRRLAGASPNGTLTVRLPRLPGSGNNFVQVEYAAEAMTRLADRAPTRFVQTFHITHPRNTPSQEVADALCRVFPWLRVDGDSLGPWIAGDSAAGARPADRFLSVLFGGTTRYCGVGRHYDRTCLREALEDDVPDPVPISPDYLDATFRAGLV
ncbi:SDR family oxidoreductase [Streptomyces netropsis]|uniref:SDR family oxidoreductase n=1 Tax=Streptomyces netropsis TaxID=55404 RepID=UPI00379BBF9C